MKIPYSFRSLRQLVISHTPVFALFSPEFVWTTTFVEDGTDPEKLNQRGRWEALILLGKLISYHTRNEEVPMAKRYSLQL